MSDPKPLGQLLQALEDSPLRAPQHELDELFGILQPRALETILSWIGRSENPQLKMLLEVAASRLAGSNSAELIRLIGSDDEAVVLEAIRRAAALKSPAAVPALGKLLTVGEADMRLAAVTALTEIGSPGAMQMLERALATCASWRYVPWVRATLAPPCRESRRQSRARIFATATSPRKWPFSKPTVSCAVMPEFPFSTVFSTPRASWARRTTRKSAPVQLWRWER